MGTKELENKYRKYFIGIPDLLNNIKAIKEHEFLKNLTVWEVQTNAIQAPDFLKNLDYSGVIKIEK